MFAHAALAVLPRKPQNLIGPRSHDIGNRPLDKRERYQK